MAGTGLLFKIAVWACHATYGRFLSCNGYTYEVRVTLNYRPNLTQDSLLRFWCSCARLVDQVNSKNIYY